MTAGDEVLGIKDVMRIAHVSQTTALRWVQGSLPDTPPLPATRIGRQWRVLKSDLLASLGPVGRKA